MIKLTDPLARFQAHQAEYQDAILRATSSGQYLMGLELESLEHEFAEYVGSTACVGVANATDGIEIALRAAGVGTGDEVITVAMTAGATISGIINSGATPVLVDVERDSRNLDPNALDSALSPRTAAVMPVHLYGNPCKVEEIRAFCDKHGLLLVEDCSQAHGAKVGRARVGSFGHIGVFSCYPTKNLGAFGDAGLVTFSDSEVAKKAAAARQYGWARERNLAETWGRNSRLDEVQAAALRVGLRYLDEENSIRQKIANRYFELLNLPLSQFDESGVWHLFVVEVEKETRSCLITDLELRGIQIGIHYQYAAHQQEFYKSVVKVNGSLTITEGLTERVVSIPIHSQLEDSEVEKVAHSFRKAIKSYAEVSKF